MDNRVLVFGEVWYFNLMKCQATIPDLNWYNRALRDSDRPSFDDGVNWAYVWSASFSACSLAYVSRLG